MARPLQLSLQENNDENQRTNGEMMERRKAEMKQYDQYQLFQVIEIDSPSPESSSDFVNDKYGITDEAMAMDYRSALELIYDGWDRLAVAIGSNNLELDLSNTVEVNDSDRPSFDYPSVNHNILFSDEDFEDGYDPLIGSSDEFTEQVAELFNLGHEAVESRSQLAAAVNALESALHVNDDLSNK